MSNQRSISLVYHLLFFLFILFSCKSDKSSVTESKQFDRLSSEEVLEQGKQIAATSFKALSAQLKTAIKKDGLQSAVKYCQTNALKITDSLSNNYNVNIKRTSEKFRNSENKPNSNELSVLLKYQNDKNNGYIMEPFVEKVNDAEFNFYSPIIINDLCLKCHGIVGETLLKEDRLYIKEFYPQDLATGYQKGDLRGMWSINFKIK